MNKDVLLSIRGLHYASMGDESEPIEVITPAEYFLRNNRHYILYDELTDDQSGGTKVRIKIAEDYVEITQKGSTNVQLLFERGKKNLSCYATPYGNFTLGVVTEQILFDEKDAEMNLKIDYLLEANNEPIADCQLELRVTEKDASLFSLEQ